MTIRIRTWGGIGDVLLTTPALRSLKRERPSVRVKVYCSRRSHFEVLRGNPYIDALTLSDNKWASLFAAQGYSARSWVRQQFHRRVGPPPAAPRSATGVALMNYGMWSPTLTGLHATEIIGRLLNVSVADRRLEVFLTEQERQRAAERIAPYRQPVALHITSKCSRNQNWPVSYWEQLVARSPEYTFFQLGLSDEPEIRGAIDWRGHLSIRESIGVLSYAHAFVGVVSSLAHATNATGTPAVVLFGPSAPDVWSHPNQYVVTRHLRCAPCIDTLQGNPCPYGAPCLSQISVEDVRAALRERTGWRPTDQSRV